MTVQDLVNELHLTVFCGQENLNREIQGGYTSDLLSDVMGFATEGQLWITLQTHQNVLAIAMHKKLVAILLVNGNEPDSDMLASAKEAFFPILGTTFPAFEITGKAYRLLH